MTTPSPDLARGAAVIAAEQQRIASTGAKIATASAADEAARRKHESDIQDQQQKISKYRDQSLNVKTNDEYRALMHEIQFAEGNIAKLEDKILEIMVAADVRKEALKKAEVELKADTEENEREKEEVRRRTAADERELAELTAKRNELRSAVGEDVLRHYDHVLKVRGTALAAVYENQLCSACSVLLRPQVFQEVMTNQQFMSCDYCKRILYYISPPPKPEDEKAAKAPLAPEATSAGEDAMPATGKAAPQ